MFFGERKTFLAERLSSFGTMLFKKLLVHHTGNITYPMGIMMGILPIKCCKEEKIVLVKRF